MVVNTVVDDIVQVSEGGFSIKEIELSIQDGSVVLWSSIRVHKLVTTELIKLIVMRVGSKLLEGIDPILIIDHGIVIVHQGIPVEVTGESDMGKGVPLFISVGSHQDVGKAIVNFDGNEVAIRSNHGLKTSKCTMLLTDPDSKCFKLCRGKNCATTTVISTLVHDGNDRSSVGLGDTTSYADLLVINLVMIETSDIDAAPCECNDTDVITKDITIGTTINKCTVIRTLLMVGDMVRVQVGLVNTDW